MPDLGSLVSFRIGDVYLPDASELLARLTERNVVVGRLVELSDCGSARDIFGVVELRDGQTVIVAMEKLNVTEELRDRR